MSDQVPVELADSKTTLVRYFYFWDKDQGTAQIPVFVSPECKDITLEVKKADGKTSQNLSLEVMKYDSGEIREGEYQVVDQVSSSGDTGLLRLSRCAHTVSDSSAILFE